MSVNSLPSDGQWHIVPDETNVGWVTFVAPSPMGKLKAGTKWDGCTHLWIEEADEEGEEIYQHVCDLDMYIAYLQTCRENSRRYFGGEFCIATISEEERLRKIQEFQQEERLMTD